MTWVTAILLPVVLLYQAWTYHVFRQRLGRGPVTGPPTARIPSPRPPADRQADHDRAGRRGRGTSPPTPAG